MIHRHVGDRDTENVGERHREHIPLNFNNFKQQVGTVFSHEDNITFE
jgi:hypothetical protein